MITETKMLGICAASMGTRMTSVLLSSVRTSLEKKWPRSMVISARTVPV